LNNIIQLTILKKVIAYCVESMGRDVDGAVQSDHEEKLMIELERYKNQLIRIGEGNL